APTPGPELTAAFDEARAASARLAVAAEIQGRLREAVAQPPLLEWFAAASSADPESWSAYAEQRTQLVDKNEADACVRLGVRALLALPADEETLSRLWRIAADADWHERRHPSGPKHPALSLLLDLCERVPKPHDTYYDGRFLRAAGFAFRGNYE